MNNNSVSGWGEMNPNHPNSCTCYLPPNKSVQYHCTNGMWTKENVSFKRNCPYHSAGGAGAGVDSTMFQLEYSDPISSGLQSIVNQAKIQEQEEEEEEEEEEEVIIQGLKDEAEKNKKKMKTLTRRRDKLDEKIAELEKVISNGYQTNKEYDGVVDHFKIMQAQMNGTNTPINPVIFDPFKRFLLCQPWPMSQEQIILAVDFYLRM